MHTYLSPVVQCWHLPIAQFIFLSTETNILRSEIPKGLKIFSKASSIGCGPHIAAAQFSGLILIFSVSLLTSMTFPFQSAVGLLTVSITSIDSLQLSKLSLNKKSFGVSTPYNK